MAVNEIVVANKDSIGIVHPPEVRLSFSRLPLIRCTRSLDPVDIERLVAFHGIATRMSQVIPEMTLAVFKCSKQVPRESGMEECGHLENATVVAGRLKEPQECPACGGLRFFALSHEHCVFLSKQILRVQETPQDIPAGDTPQTVVVNVYGDLIDVVKPGDRVEVTGIYRVSPVRITARTTTISAVMKTYVDGIHLRILTNASLKVALAAPLPQTAIIQQIEEIRNDSNLYERLVDSFAPNIWELRDIKKGLLCQLFGGNDKHINPSSMGGQGNNRVRSRGNIQVLLCGDPATAKSQLLQYVHKLAPRGIYAVGRGTSAAGLTATVKRDPDTKDFILESGAVVLSDRGVCCIDEFDKMDQNTRAALHEVMEQQTVSLAKAGIVCSMNARTAVLAAANPVKSKYDTSKSVIENINLPAALLSRFDLIYLVLDTQDEAMDRRLADHLCRLYTAEGAKSKEAADQAESRASKSIHPTVLTAYIAKARSECFPCLSREAMDSLKENYLKFRHRGSCGSSSSLSATPRQLDSLTRIAEALAKMELCSTVSKKHVEEAARLIEIATYSAVTDPLTGRIDFEQLNRGMSTTARAREQLIGDAILEMIAVDERGLTKEQIEDHLAEYLVGMRAVPLTRRELDQMLRGLQSLGSIGRSGTGAYIKAREY